MKKNDFVDLPCVSVKMLVNVLVCFGVSSSSLFIICFYFGDG